MDRSVAALKVLEESKISKAPPPRRRAIIPKAKPAAVSSVADKSSRPRLAAILEMHREKFGGREDTSEGSDVEMESSSEDEEADSDDEDSDSSDDEELKADLEPMQAIIGSSLKTATAGAPPPPTRAARDPFPVPPPGSVLSGTIILENHMKEEHKPLVVCTETFSVAVTVAGEANGAPIFRAFELLWAFRLRHENAMDVDNWRGLSPMLSYTIDSSTKSRPTEHELFRIDSYDWSDLTSLSPPLPNDGKDVKIIGIMVAVDSVEIRLRLTGVPFVSLVISFGPENVGAVLCWGNNCHLRTYRALVAQEPTDKDVRDLIARNGTSLTTLRSLKIFLGVSDATSSPSKSPVKRRISSSSGDDSDAAGRSRRSKSTPQRRSAGGKAKSGGSSLISAISSPQLLLGLLLLALAAPVSAQSLRLRDLAKSLPSDFTALQLFIVVGLVIANLQLARLSQAQLVATSHQSRGRARFTSWIRAVSKLIFLSNPSAELSKESVYSAVELVAEAVEAELEQGDLDAIERSGRPRAPHTLLVTNYTSCPQCDRGYIQKLSSSHDVVLLDVDGPREASVLKAICTHCRTRFTPDRYRVRMPHSNRAVQVLDGTAKFVRLGAKYWATRRLANSLLLQHYHHMSFAAVSTAYHEGLDEDNLSRADRQHFFKLFVLEIVLRHSESTASPFLIDPLWSFTELIQSADLELFGRWCTEHQEEFFGPECYEAACGVIGCEETMALDDFLARNGNPKDFHAVQNWNRDARNAAPRARPDENAPWRQKHSEHSSRVVQSTWHPQRYNNLSMLVRPCGVPVSATRMLMSESEDETIKFLKETFELIDPGKAPRDNRPSFLVYDRGCKALARLIETDEWEEWEETTRLLVDRLHYLGHLASPSKS
ncbi:hypothetical protein RQP46_008955 [Phenoliferia psychrophenolica]